MGKRISIIVAALAGVAVAAYLLNSVSGYRLSSARQPPRFAAVPVEKGGQDILARTGRSRSWPKDLTTLPGNEGWTFGAGQSVFAENPNRVFVLQRGEAAGDRASAEPEGSPRASCSRSAACRGATRRRRACRATAGPARLRKTGIQAWLKAGNKLGEDARWEHNTSGLRRAGQPGRVVDAVGRDDAAAALRRHQPVRPAEARLDPRRPQARHLQDDERRQADRADDRHLRRARQRRQALQPADLPRLVPGRQLRGGRRLQRHARRRSSTRTASS